MKLKPFWLEQIQCYMVEAIIAIFFISPINFQLYCLPKQGRIEKKSNVFSIKEEIERTSNYKAKPYVIPSIPIQFTRSKRSTSGIVHVYCYQFA